MGTRSSPITWFIWRSIEGAFLYFLAMPITVLLQIIGTPLSVGTGLPLPWVGSLLALSILAGLLYKAHKR